MEAVTTPMTAVEMRGKRLEAPIREEIARQRLLLLEAGRPLPRLATILVGDDPAAGSYRASIARTFGRLGVDHLPVDLPATAGTSEILASLKNLNQDETVSGIMVFLPLPGRKADLAVRDAISPLKDVDGISPLSAGNLRLGRPTLEPACPRAGVGLLQAHGVQLAGAPVTVIGRSPVVGSPLAAMLTMADATVTVCHRGSRDIVEWTGAAEIVACAAGTHGVLTGDMIKPGTTVLDFGTNVLDGHLVGDAVRASVERVAGRLSPVPGGTGPATSLVLAYQTVLAAHATAAGTLEAILDAPSIGQLATSVASNT
ncbi:MAG TPA: bifunctional 5,10-methylenetetrahydrofolate dehydrogenase/5,10-methenyltetrahydrofolate cyclohydrolase [Thermomicrobiales bacterium]|jgi:methylenetetrahydrofolate dehydrogenase (NADP+)/methenyltetrahydrofolate cyclohydrolase|nr:bifunctional 5,10-methylenetetrahydrofolate dehydrogenase/5,10-methenyltetrahydrofolate cyclohydrolase [Thermomicrobiales bacterium]